MNEILLNVLSAVVTVIVLPLISYAGVKLSTWLSTKIKNDKAKQLLTTATGIVFNAVGLVSQTYVDSLKASGSFDEEAQRTALTKAKEAALSQMNEEVVDYITTTYGDLDNWLTTQIEATIHQEK